ncbi:hypothetical protein SBA4_5030013 [Candidatus Sulfopaludibacter sp. SbA4]|nr:hypothetical protein SBA4_5030013 [Candidatus Sulfopaludibacter sp. SbA4]
MPSRRRSRQRALQILFLWDARRQPVDEAIDGYYDTLYSEEHPERDPFVADLVRGTVEHVAEVDEQISKHRRALAHRAHARGGPQRPPPGGL